MSDTVEPILYEASSEPIAKVVLVHGALDRAMAFRGVLQRLHQFDTTVYDRRGYGASVGLTQATSLDDHVDDLVQVLDDTPSVVIGHSMGGVVALLAAARRPDLVRSLGVFEAPIPGVHLSSDESTSDAAGVPEDPEHLVRWMYRRVVGESAFERMNPRAQRALIDEAPALRADLLAMREVEEPFDPSTVPAPTIVGYGTSSEQRHIDRATWLAEHLPTASLFEAPDAAHACHRTHPEHFTEFITRVAANAE